jgi:hypothetical protein
MCKKIFSLSILLLSSMMMIFSCCEAEKEEPENKPAPASPQTPVITAESKKFTYEVNVVPEVLTITASVTDGGKLSYQWYKSDSADGEYTVVAEATVKDFTPDTSAVGTTYYKCVVTNTLDGKTASADGAVFTVEVIEKKGVEDKEATRPKVEAITEYTVEVNKEETLAVTAESLDGGKLSYKWSKSSDKETFEELADETTASLVIKPTEIGTFYYKCEVTNSVELDGETKTATSDVVITVTVVDGKGNINIDFN